MIESIERSPDVRDLVSLALVEGRGARPGAGEPELGDEIARAVEDLCRSHAGQTAGQIPHLQPARELYHALGIDPTRHRPSPEALLRRILRGDEFPRIHPAVDLGNLWALLSGLPIGLYDMARVEGGKVTVRRGAAGESFPGINKPEIHVEGRLVLADARGPFGNPTSDSARTAVGAQTTDLLYVMFAPTGFDIGRLDRWTAWLRERLEALLEARAISGVLP
ncbi:MAG: hypothetical protein KBD01_12110 [Acidobacteria bacterium]|nr:hypothetical protein [Acidobacteriota bacterium]